MSTAGQRDNARRGRQFLAHYAYRQDLSSPAADDCLRFVSPLG